MSCQCQLISIPTRQIASQRGRTLKCTNSSPIVSASQALVVSSNQNHLANFINLVLRHTGQGKATNTPATALHCYVLIANHNARLIRAVGICGNFPVSKKTRGWKEWYGLSSEETGKWGMDGKVCIFANTNHRGSIIDLFSFLMHEVTTPCHDVTAELSW